MSILQINNLVLDAIIDSVDPTKELVVSLTSATTNTSTTLDFDQTANRIITFPDATTTLVGTNTTQLLTNKTLDNNNCYFVDNTDTTKQIGFQSSGATTGTTLTLASDTTVNQTITFPNATTTLVGTGTTQSLTNKTITDSSNDVISQALWIGSGSGSVSTYAASAPSSGQVLTATNSTTAVWQTPIVGITSLNTLTATSQTFATGTSGTDFNIVSATSTHTFNIPSASTTARGLITTGTQILTGSKTFSSPTQITDSTASTSPTTGALTVTGGIGSGSNINANGSLTAGNPSSTTAMIHALQGTLGNEVVRLESSTTNSLPVEIVYQNKVTTTDATATTLNTFTVPAETTYYISAIIVARRTGGSAGTAEDGCSFELKGVYNNISGVATIIGTVYRLINKSQPGWDVNLVTSTNTVEIQVTGAVNNNITWHTTSRVYQVSS